jgi:hypothetical protein
MPDLWPFGKLPADGGHKGESLDDLPEEFIVWCLEDGWLKNDFWTEKLEAELERRRKKAADPPPAPAIHFPAHLQDFAESIILDGFREGRIKYAQQPAALKMLQHARDLLEKFAGLA